MSKNGQPGGPDIYKADDEKPRTEKIVVEKVIIPEEPDYDKIDIEMKGDRFLCQVFPRPTQIGRIIMPNNEEASIDRGRVVKIGPDVKNLKVGDIIFKMAGLGQALGASDGNIYTFHPENAAIALDTYAHEITPESELKKIMQTE